MRLQSLLAPQYRIVEEGQNSRTTVFEDPFEPGKKGLDYLLPCLESHHPDMVVIMLGTNDLKTRFNATANDISKGAARLVQVVQKFHHDYMAKPPEVLLISPAHVLETDPLWVDFNGAEEKSKHLAHFYRLRSEELNCHFLDAAKHITPCAIEGVHWQQDQHERLAEVLAKLIPSLLPSE
jgi:lysophospholipase L1-like esterase